MISIIAFVVGIVGVLSNLSNGIPLEGPSSDLGQFFDQRIVGGSEAAEGRAPHVAALVVGWSWQSLACGASIISRRGLLTAGHCVRFDWHGDLLDTFHAIVGTNIWHSGTVVEFESYTMHPDYDYMLIMNDIAVLTTKEPIQMGERVAPIALTYDRVGAGRESYVAAWGSQSLWGTVPDKLHILYVRTISHEQCLASVQELADLWGWMPPLDPDMEICTLHSPGHGMCHGDSGSALVSVDLKKQFGIVSWGLLACAEGYPDVYVHLTTYKKFIEDCTKTH